MSTNNQEEITISLYPYKRKLSINNNKSNSTPVKVTTLLL